MVEDETISKYVAWCKSKKREAALRTFPEYPPSPPTYICRKIPKKCEIILKAVDTQGVQGAVATCFNLSSELVWTQVRSDHHIFEDNLLERELPENNLIQTCNFQKKKRWKINRFPLPWWFAETLAIDGCIRAVTRHYSARTNLCLPELDTFCNISSSKLPLNRISLLRKTTQSGQMWLRCQMPYSSETSLIVDCCYCSLV